MKRSSGSVLLYLFLVFGSGAVVGAFAHKLYTGSVSANAGPGFHNSEEMRHRYVSEMQSRLKLDADQVQKLNAILDTTRARFHEARQKIEPEMKSIKEDQVAQIRSVLTDSQKAEYEKYRAEREKRMKDRGPRP